MEFASFYQCPIMTSGVGSQTGHRTGVLYCVRHLKPTFGRRTRSPLALVVNLFDEIRYRVCIRGNDGQIETPKDRESSLEVWGKKLQSQLGRRDGVKVVEIRHVRSQRTVLRVVIRRQAKRREKRKKRWRGTDKVDARTCDYT
jgi:hypothetical protein